MCVSIYVSVCVFVVVATKKLRRILTHFVSSLDVLVVMSAQPNRKLSVNYNIKQEKTLTSVAPKL